MGEAFGPLLESMNQEAFHDLDYEPFGAAEVL